MCIKMIYNIYHYHMYQKCISILDSKFRSGKTEITFGTDLLAGLQASRNSPLSREIGADLSKEKRI